MRFFKSLSVLAISLFLVLGYFIVDRNFLSIFTQWKNPFPESLAYDKTFLDKAHEYTANNMFDIFFERELGMEIVPRLSIYPQNTPLKEEKILLPGNSGDTIVTLVLPNGFKNGFLLLKTQTESDYKVALSFDLHEWKSSDYPGFKVLTRMGINFERANDKDKAVYLKFTSNNNRQINIYFEAFLYTANLANDQRKYRGILFYPDIDIDYDGKEIQQQGIYYESN